MPRKVEVIGYRDLSEDKAWLRPWELLREGDTKRALEEMAEMHKRHTSPSNVITYGVLMLYAGAYGGAYDHFSGVIEKHPFEGESEYTYAGIALWCMDKVSGAISMWKEGMNARYAPGGFCIQTAMLLLTASILKPGSITRGDAESVLFDKASDPRADTWPWTLSQYIAGIIDIKRLEASKHDFLRRRNATGDLRHRTWLIDFYKELARIGQDGHGIEGFQQSMKVMADPTADDWKEVEDFALLVRQPEYFVARHATRQS